MKKVLIKVENLIKKFHLNGEEFIVLNNINLEVYEGEILTIIGPNGCGKTTFLNIIAGIERPSLGNIIFLKNNLKFGFMFQDYKPTLLPWKKVWENIALPLLWNGWGREKAKEFVENMLEDFNINLPLYQYPFQLSGGQSQLVGILRAFLINPDILILDEPFSALDFFNRTNLILKFQKIWLKYKPTTFFVSHDVEEAIFLGDRIILFSTPPSTIVKEIVFKSPRPRDIKIMSSQEFVNIKREILEFVGNYI